MVEQIGQITQELEASEANIHAAATEYRSLSREAADKRVRYDIAYAQELLKVSTDKSVKLTVAEKEAMALLAVQGPFTECRIAEAIAEGCKRQLQALQGNQTSLQTRASLIKTESFAMGRQI